MEIVLSGKRALVTGANSGIGEAIALAFARAGAAVAVNYVTRPEAAQDVVRLAEAAGARSIAVQADVSDAGSVEAMFDQIEKAWGGLDILVNNAGVDGDRALGWEADLASWRRVFEINLFGVYYCARAALPGMVARGSGVVLNITSVHERIPWGGYSAYCASKAAVSMLTRTLAQEAAPRGVRILALAPGAIRTPINRQVWENPKAMADLKSKIPLGRMGETEEVARMAVVLSSDAASYATGATVFVDGGMTLYPSFAHGG